MATELQRPERLGATSATLPSLRVLLLSAGVLVVAESAALGVVLFAFAALSFAASMGLATLIYRRRSNLAASDGAEVGPGQVQQLAVALVQQGKRSLNALSDERR